MALLLLTVIRIALAAAGLGAAIAVGGSDRAAGLAFVLGALGGALVVLADPRRRPVHPRAAQGAPWWHQALKATVPSTLGLAVLAGVALAFNAVLSAALAGIVGGLAVGGLVAGAGRLAS